MTRRLRFFLIPTLGALICAGCGHEEIRSYTVEKQKPDADAPAPPSAESPARPRPKLSYTLPADWRDLGSNNMSLANFKIKNEAGEATVNITPLGSMAGGETAIVNMWREQVGQPPLPDSEAAATLSPVDVGGEGGQLFEITGERDGQSLRIVTAFVHRSDGSWFYKLQGPDAAVSADKPAFIEFLKSVHVVESGAPPSAVAGSEPAMPKFHWKMPEGWHPIPPGQMQVAKFSVPEHDGAKAEVSVSIFPSDTGGVLGNVNRWRKQIGLSDTDEAGLKDCTSPLESAPGGVLVDLAKENRHLLGAIVPRDGQWWFYKLLGDVAAVTPEHENFVQFVQSKP